MALSYDPGAPDERGTWVEAMRERAVRGLSRMEISPRSIHSEGERAIEGPGTGSSHDAVDEGLPVEASGSVPALSSRAASGLPTPAIGRLLDAVGDYACAAVNLEKAERAQMSTQDAMLHLRSTYRRILDIAYGRDAA